jgi:hypothetical protein
VYCRAGKQLSTLQDELDRTKRELELVSTPAARAHARKNTAEEREGEGEGEGGTPRKDLRKELQQSLKQVDEWRRKTQAAQEEAKKLSRVLAKELGDGVALGE